MTLARAGNKLRLSVADDGAGLNETELAKVWDRFYQTDASRNKETNNGLGLGLATVAAIAKLHGGRAWATSAPDRGSTFYLEV